MNLPNASEFIENVNKFSGMKLRAKDDLEKIFEILLKEDNLKSMQDFVFYGKYVNGLIRIIKSPGQNLEEKYIDSIKKELTGNLEKVRLIFSKSCSEMSEFYRAIFNEKYLELTQLSLDNLINLCYDLDWIKTYLNENNFSF